MRGSEPGLADGPGTPWTWANLVTAVRVLVCVVLFAIGFSTRDLRWALAGLVTYWVLDIVDGALARHFDQETRLGAQFDILADRLLVMLFYLDYLVLHPEMLVPVVLFLVQFMGIDHHLSNQYLRWPIKSPNYFYLIDRRVWLLNWSAPGKLLNSAVVTLVLVGTGSPWLGSFVAIAILVLKAWSVCLIARLPSPEPGWRLGERTT